MKIPFILAKAMDKLTRRALLTRTWWAAVLSVFGRACMSSRTWTFAPKEEMETGLNEKEIEAIRVCLDLLIPADETPSATTVGVDVCLRDEANADAQIAALLRQGLLWLGAQTGDRGADDFPALPEAEQVALLELAEAADPESVEQRFFSYLRSRAFHYYYATPIAFSFPGYLSSPQPDGYPDYSKPIVVKQ